jgi:hypothetical protein
VTSTACGDQGSMRYRRCFVSTSDDRIDRLHYRLMAITARFLCHAAVSLGNAKRIGIASSREIKRMPESVPGFRDVLPNRIVRRMTVVAGCSAMASLLPRCEMFAHDMAVRARGRIVGEIRSAPGIAERKHADPCCETKSESSCNRRALRRSHSRGVALYLSRPRFGMTSPGGNFQTL